MMPWLRSVVVLLLVLTALLTMDWLFLRSRSSRITRLLINLEAARQYGLKIPNALVQRPRR
jgi:hypothetical protein